jgi:hypothetical protein
MLLILGFMGKICWFDELYRCVATGINYKKRLEIKKNTTTQAANLIL